jgi:hypothetical protein
VLELNHALINIFGKLEGESVCCYSRLGSYCDVNATDLCLDLCYIAGAPAVIESRIKAAFVVY